MSESYAFLDTGAGPSAIGAARLIPERNDFVPSWYVPHENPESIRVTQKGNPIPPGFTVAEVLPERRWAIGPDGEVLEPLQFREMYLRKMEEWFRVASTEAQQGARFAPPKEWKSHLEYIPDVRRYVSIATDRRDRRKLLAMGFDPEANSGARPERLYDAEGESFVEGRDRLRLLTEWYHRDPSRLTKAEREEVEAGRVGPAPAATARTETQARLDMLADQLARGVLTTEQHTQEVASVLGIARVEGAQETKAEKPKRKAPLSIMPCGEKVYPFHKNRHRASCEACKEAS